MPMQVFGVDASAPVILRSMEAGLILQYWFQGNPIFTAVETQFGSGYQIELKKNIINREDDETLACSK
jgi:hypothetical protein